MLKLPERRGLVAQVLMQYVTEQKNNQEQLFPPETDFQNFSEGAGDVRLTELEGKRAETLKVGWVLVFIFYFPVFYPCDLMGCGRYVGEFSQCNPPIKTLTWSCQCSLADIQLPSSQPFIS